VCGVCGIIPGGGDPKHQAVVSRMNRIQRRRGPDDSGVTSVIAEGFSCTLGHTRLAIIDRAGGTQPMTDRESGASLVYNGEIYNHPLLRRELESAGCTFRTRSDTEVLLKGYLYWGIEALLQRIDGMFAFGIADPRQHLLILARDPAGQKPLYYTEDRGQLSFAFASTLKALSTVPWFDQEIDSSAVELFLNLRVVPAPYSIYRNTRKLPPGSYLVHTTGSTVVKEYWSPFNVALRSVPSAGSELLEEYRSLLRSTLSETLVSDVPVSLLLSSGVDSTSLACELGMLPERDEVTAYTVGFTEKGYDESDTAADIARHLKLNHRILAFNDTVFEEQIETLCEIADEPFGDPSILPSLGLCRTVAVNSRVALGGDGADELFGGYPTFSILRFWPLINHFPDFSRALCRAATHLIPSTGIAHSRALKLERMAQGLGHSGTAAFARWLCIFSPEESALLLGKQCPETFAGYVASQTSGMEHMDPVNTMCRSYFRLFLPGVLEKMDRASMHYSLETRAPFLQRRMVEFALSLPPQFKVRHGTTKHLMRRSLADYLPGQIAHAPKKGFLPPLAARFAGPWGAEQAGMMENACDSFGIDRSRIRAMSEEHRAGRRDQSQRLWLIHQLGLFLRNQGNNTSNQLESDHEF
jgi:asparagine synthase (glutamine-hydrolysing)